MKGKQAFSDKQKLREFVANNPALQDVSKEVLQGEGK